MRLFVALDIDQGIRERIQQFVSDLHRHAPDVRFVGPETYHITLKFLGESSRVDEIKHLLASVRASSVDLRFGGTGFFPAAKNARVFWAGIHAGPELAALQSAVESALSPLGFEREKGPYHPHLTLARSGSGRPRNAPGDKADPRFQRIQERLSALPEPEFGTMTAREFFLYESRLSPRGAQYLKLQRFPLDERL